MNEDAKIVGWQIWKQPRGQASETYFYPKWEDAKADWDKIINSNEDCTAILQEAWFDGENESYKDIDYWGIQEVI